MQENSWQENDSYDESVNSLLSELSNLAEVSEDRFSLGFAGRRRKAAIALTIIWSGTIALHLFAAGSWLVLALMTVMGIHALRILFARPLAAPPPLSSDNPADYPFVSVLVAAKNEEAVIGKLVDNLCNLDYPLSRYDLWIIDDNSSDRTPLVLEGLAQKYDHLHVVRRLPNAPGGKSGALNQVWSITAADIIAVFDADAQVPRDLLRRVLPIFEPEQVGAVQVRKSVSNAATNLWTRAQTAEMALDSYFQQQRITIGGIGELRGNGQFVRRKALESCGGWNEETITDDLDLTLRLHIDRWDIQFLMLPAVGEEGVTNAVGLWHQRNRWAEGGYQRYLDYWRLIVQNRLSPAKRLDLLMFLITQYMLPTAAVPDCLMAILRSSPPVLLPITSLATLLALIGMTKGLQQTKETYPHLHSYRRHSYLAILAQTLLGTVYMLHWLPIMAATTARMSVRPKRLKWVKTVHHGDSSILMDEAS